MQTLHLDIHLQRSIGVEEVGPLALRSLSSELALLDVPTAGALVDLQVDGLVAPPNEDGVLLVVREVLVQGAKPGLLAKVEEVFQLSILQLQSHEVAHHRAWLGALYHSVGSWSLIEQKTIPS